MKKLPFINVLILGLSMHAFSQKSKRVDLCSGPYGLFHVSAHISFSGESPVDTMFHVLGRNSKYVHLVDYITVKSGSVDDVHDFFRYCIEFLAKEEDGMSEEYNGNHIAVTKMLGVKGLMIYEEEDGSGYTGFNQKALNKILTCITKWHQSK